MGDAKACKGSNSDSEGLKDELIKLNLWHSTPECGSDNAWGVAAYTNGRNSGTIWAKAVFQDPSGTKVRNPGLSQRFWNSWQL